MKGHNMNKPNTIKNILESVGGYVGGFCVFLIVCQTLGLDWQLMAMAMRDSMLLYYAPMRLSLGA